MTRGKRLLSLLLSVLLACKERGEIVSVIMGDDMITGRVLEANGKTLDCVCAAGPPGFESGQYEGLICV